jgi:CHAD domain-containing protein
MALTTNSAVCNYGAEVIQRSLSAFRKEIPGVMESRDIESVHRLRVASRRLVTALDVFQICYPTKRVKAWKKDFTQATSILGKARDLDIQAEEVGLFLKATSSSDLRPGVRRLSLRLEQKRKRAQAKLVNMLVLLEKNQALASLKSYSRDLSDKYQAGSSREVDILPVFAGETILPILDNFLSYEPFIDIVEAVEEMHAMRIAAKKLRYTLECFSSIYADGLVEYLSVMRMIQDQLGLMHDCDLWLATSSHIIAMERRRTEKYFGSTMLMKRLMPGYMAFFENRRQKRIETYQAFTEYWHELHLVGIWVKLSSRVAPENQTKHVSIITKLE